MNQKLRLWWDKKLHKLGRSILIAIVISVLFHLPILMWMIKGTRFTGGLEKVQRADPVVLSVVVSSQPKSPRIFTRRIKKKVGVSKKSFDKASTSSFSVSSLSSVSDSDDPTSFSSQPSVSSVFSESSSDVARSSCSNIASHSSLGIENKKSGKFRFLTGERVVFDIEVHVDELDFVKGMVGEVEITVLDHEMTATREVTHCRAVARTLGTVASLYQLEDVFDTWFDTDTFEVLRYSKIVNEGGWRDAITNELDIPKGTGRHFSKQYLNGKNFVLPDRAYDMITLLYLIRAVGKNQALRLNLIADEGQITPLLLEYHPEEDLQVMTSMGLKKIKVVPLVDLHTGIRIDLAKYYHYFPVRAIIPAFQTAGYTFTLRANFRSYRPGKKE